VHSVGSEQGSVTGCCEYGHRPWGSGATELESSQAPRMMQRPSEFRDCKKVLVRQTHCDYRFVWSVAIMTSVQQKTQIFNKNTASHRLPWKAVTYNKLSQVCALVGAG
jgi:hypothetical protein